MEEQKRIEELERRISEMEKYIESLKNQTPGQATKKMQIEELEVRQIRIVEKNGTVRMSIHNKELMPTFPERVGGTSAGMLFFADDGVEVGGLTINNTVNLKFDQHHSTDVVGLVNAGSIKGLFVWDRPPGALADFINQFEKEHGRRPLIQELELTRIFAGRWINGESKVSLCDSRGIERLRILVDSNDIPRIELLNENGEITNAIAPKNFKSLTMPSLNSVPKDLTTRTPAHLLGIFDDNIDKTLSQLDEARERFDKEVYTAWREWLLKAKELNSNSKTE